MAHPAVTQQQPRMEVKNSAYSFLGASHDAISGLIAETRSSCFFQAECCVDTVQAFLGQGNKRVSEGVQFLCIMVSHPIEELRPNGRSFARLTFARHGAMKGLQKAKIEGILAANLLTFHARSTLQLCYCKRGMRLPVISRSFSSSHIHIDHMDSIMWFELLRFERFHLKMT